MRHALRRTRARRAATAMALVGATLAVYAASVTAPAPDASAGVGSAVTKSITLDRTHLIRNSDVVVDSRDVSVTVSQTTNLRDRQAIEVTWSGAHPTGGVVADRNSAFGAQQEYPVVLLQCRGQDVPGSKMPLDPRRCWTSDPAERAQSSTTFLWPPFRIDRYATPVEREAFVGVPSPVPAECRNSVGGAQHWIPFDSADGTVYVGGPGGCGGIAPEAGGGSATAPSNTTYGVTDVDGTGRSDFVINTVDSNASLGCSQSVPCSLVVIPVMGIGCDSDGAALPVADRPVGSDKTAADTLCRKTGHYLPGQLSDLSVNTEDLAVSGQLWWAASNWRNRFSFPLGFSLPSNVCDLVSAGSPSLVYGTQALVQATQQWAPYFCLDPKLFKFQHVQFSEPGSRNLLENGSVEAAFSAGPPQTPFTKKIVQAPVAVTGFAIAFRLDDAKGREVRSVNLTPRLLAKLLTMSYATGVGFRKSYSALSTNPLSIVDDPEFRALNPGMMEYINGYDFAPAATLYAMSSDSDVMWALTSYINADPDARAWLDGKADPWGAVVNPNYKGVVLPTVSWPILDTEVNKSLDAIPCFAAAPLPYLPLVASPVSNPATISLNMQYGLSASQLNCVNAGQPNQKLGPLGRLVPGRRAMFGLISLADAVRYQIPTASLLAHTAADATSAFTDTTGRTFAAPNDASLKAAARLLEPDKELGTWVLPYSSALRGPSGAGAYAGTMLVSMAVPTSGLPSADATRYAQMIRLMATTLQRPGFDTGQLPPGYLPLTAANGLADQVKYSLLSATQVQAQAGVVPGLDGSLPPAPTPTPTPTPTPNVPTTGQPSTDPGTTDGQPSGGPVATPSASPSASPSPSASVIAIQPVGLTSAIVIGPWGQALPYLLAVALLAGALALITVYGGRR